jgi:thioredoxin-related protein
MHKILGGLVFILLISPFVVATPKPPKADQVLADAKAKASEQHKSIFLIFGASWCPECHTLDSFLDEPAIRAIFEKYFVIAHLSAYEELAGHANLNNPGSDKLMIKFGGVAATGEAGFPYLVILDESGSPRITSNRPVKENPAGESIGFPTQPEEIAWFLTMLKTGVPSLAAEEVLAIKLRLRRGM